MSLRRTNIPYADYHWEPAVGCTLPLESEGCYNCWARDLHNKRHKARLCGKKLPAMYHAPFETLQFFPERLKEPLQTRKPGVVFVGSQTDLFGKDVPFEYVDKVMGVIAACQQHQFLLLTKRGQGMAEYFCTDNVIERIRLACHLPVSTEALETWRWQYPLPNLYSGLTACTQSEADAKWRDFSQVPGKKFLSLEPLLEPVLPPFRWLDDPRPRWRPGYEMFQRTTMEGNIGAVIVGAESGVNRRECKTEWIRSIVERCKSAGTPIYVKQLHDRRGKVLTHWEGVSEEDWPLDLRVKQLPWGSEPAPRNGGG